MKESDSPAARQADVPDAAGAAGAVAVVEVAVVVAAVAVVVDELAVVVVVAVAIARVVVLEGAADAVADEEVDACPAPELPHAAINSASGSRASRLITVVVSRMASSHPSPGHRRPRCVPLSRTEMDPSEELRQTPARRRESRVRMVERILPFWEPQLVIACVIALQLSLTEQVTIGPSWLLPALEGGVLIGLVIVSPHPNVRHSRFRRHVAIGMIAFVSLANIVSLVLLCHYLLHGGKANGHALILSGIALWCTNVLLFGLWYWEVDRGGPNARARGEADYPDFLFPQMSDAARFAPSDWRPRLIDYLYLSLTNATAFSPTDTMPLTPTAKWIMSAQSVASLVTVGLVVARAVNILGS